MNYSKGISWIDDCRIPFVDEGENTIRNTYDTSVKTYGWVNHKGQMGSFDDSANQGRFPANLLCSDDMLNDGIIYKSGDGKGMSIIKRNGKTNGVCKMDMGYSNKAVHYGDKGSNSRYYDIDKWFNKLLDELQ